MINASHRALLIKWIGHVLMAASAGFIIYVLIDAYQAIPRIEDPIKFMVYLSGALLIATFTIFVNAIIWKVLLDAGHSRISMTHAFVITGKSQIAKYLPGNFMQFVSRYAFSKSQGIGSEPILIATAIESFLVVITASSISLIGILFQHETAVPLTAEMNTSRPLILLSGIAVIVVLGLLPRVRHWLIDRRHYLRPRLIAGVMSLVALDFLSMGFVFYLVMVGYLNALDVGYFALTWAFSLAWTVGFLTPGAPGGIGIRELVLYIIFRDQLGPAPIAAGVLIMRLVTILSDMLAFGIAFSIERRNVMMDVLRR